MDLHLEGKKGEGGGGGEERKVKVGKEGGSKRGSKERLDS